MRELERSNILMMSAYVYSIAVVVLLSTSLMCDNLELAVWSAVCFCAMSATIMLGTIYNHKGDDWKAPLVVVILSFVLMIPFTVLTVVLSYGYTIFRTLFYYKGDDNDD